MPQPAATMCGLVSQSRAVWLIRGRPASRAQTPSSGPPALVGLATQLCSDSSCTYMVSRPASGLLAGYRQLQGRLGEGLQLQDRALVVRGRYSGLREFEQSIFRPHSHDAADSVDSSLEAGSERIRAVKIGLAVV